MPKGDLIPAILEVKCLCGKPITIRTKEAEKEIPCWNCLRKIKVKMWAGYGKFQVTVDGQSIRHEVIWQG